MTLEEVNKRFVYKLDKEQFRVNELWTGLQDVDGKLVGDCEDYAISLKREVEGFKDWSYYYCKLNGSGHCVLSNSAMIIDCNSQETMLKDKFMQRYNITELKKYSKFVIFCKYLFAKVFLFFKKGY